MKKILLTLLTIISLSANADNFPSDNMLKDLQEYTNNKIKCADLSCNSINNINIEYHNNIYDINFNISAREDSIIELPININNNLLDITMDGGKYYKVIKEQNKLKVVINKGNHELKLKLQDSDFIIINNDKLNVDIDSNLKADSKNGNIIISNFKEKSSHLKDDENKIKMSNYYQVNREIYLDKTWKIKTIVTPIINNNQISNLEVDLIEGEKILNSNIKVENNKALISIENESISWDSELSPKNTIFIQKSSDKKYNQRITITPSEFWKYNVEKNPNEININYSSWILWENEDLKVNISVPKSIYKNDLSLYNLNITKNNNNYEYNFKATSSLANKINIQIPEDYKLSDLIINQQKININEDIKNLPLDLRLGENQIQFNLIESENNKIIKNFPKVKFPKEVHNVKYSYNNYNNWILYSGGADINTDYILISSLLILGIIAFLTSKINKEYTMLSLICILFGFLQSAMFILLILPIILVSIKYKNKIIELHKTTQNNVMYNFYQGMLIILSIIFVVSFLITLKYGLLDNPTSWTLLNTNTIVWLNEAYTDKNIWCIEISSTIYHIIMFIWSIYISNKIIKISKDVFKSIFEYELYIKS